MSPVLLHLHIPKTGGNTLIHLIYRFHASSDHQKSENGLLKHGIYYYPRGIEEDAYILGLESPNEVDPPKEVISAIRRPDVNVISGHFAFGLHRYLDRPARYVTVLRDPVERVVSLYYQARRNNKKTRIQRRVTEGRVTLEEFVTSFGYKQADNGQTRRICGREPSYGQCTREMLEIAQYNLQRTFTIVGTLERFQETVNVMSHRLRWKKVEQDSYERRNVNPSKPSLESIPPATRDMILERNALDVELYDFANSLMDEAMAGIRS